MDENLTEGLAEGQDAEGQMAEGQDAELLEPVPVKNNSRAVAMTVFGVVMLAIVALVALFYVPKGSPVGGVLPGDPKGYALPEITLDRLDGQGKLSLKDYVGQPLVINFWGSWCTTCEVEAEILGDAERKWRDQGVVFIGVDSKDEQSAAQAFEAKYGMDYVSVLDPEGLIAADWGVTGFPETFFVGKDGRITYKFISAIDEINLDTNIRAILQ